jgi:UDP-N-acetylglucosamine transferase subunit ALG13
LVDDQVYAQIGSSEYKPRNFEYVEFLQKNQFDSYVRNATGIISHAGMGVIMMALEYKKPLLVMPRCKKFGEVVNDHQAAVTEKFEELGCILVATDKDGLHRGIQKLKCFTPKPRLSNPAAVADRICSFINNLQD